ncbi:MAG: multidrug efflux SMR transporter [Bacteroidota bacterium]
MSWFYILIASFFEICWAVGLKYSNGFTEVKPTTFTIITMILSYVFLALGSKNLPIGTAYAVWTGIGAVGTAIYGMLFFNEPKELVRIFFIFLIVVGIIGLKLTYKTTA